MKYFIFRFYYKFAYILGLYTTTLYNVLALVIEQENVNIFHSELIVGLSKPQNLGYACCKLYRYFVASMPINLLIMYCKKEIDGIYIEK